jgi:penicillin-binding protein 2
MANSMCIIANKGYFYTPHFVEKIDGQSEDDSVLNKFRVKHEVLTHIPDNLYEVVSTGMQDVVETGTARAAKVPGINICAKTGTAETYRLISGKRAKLKNNSIFVCFAPREDPKIAIAIVVENAGFGATWAAPMGSFLIEKYLTDSIRSDRMKEVERIAGTNLLPNWIIVEQYYQDSLRAAAWAKQTGDSTRWIKYRTPSFRSVMRDTLHTGKQPLPPILQNSPADKPKDIIIETDSTSNL